MAEIWETAFQEKQTMWGREPTRSALLARDLFAQEDVKEVLIPGIGYGRNALAFLDKGMSVTGIEISATAIGLARAQLGLDIPIYHGSVTDMPYDQRIYDGIFGHGMLYLLDAGGREKFLRDCSRQLAPGGPMIFSLIAKTAPMYGRGPRLGEDWYEILPGMRMFFYDEESIRREFAPHGEVEISTIDEPAPGGGALPFLSVICRQG
jgi:SAM-dependent methyltransferase